MRDGGYAAIAPGSQHVLMHPYGRQPGSPVRVLHSEDPTAMSFFRRTSSTLLAALVYATLFGFALLVYLLRL